MAIIDILNEALTEHIKALIQLFICISRWDIEIPGVRFINDLAGRRSLFSSKDADSFTRCFIILLQDEYDFASLLFDSSPSWLLKVCSGANDEEIFWSGTSEDIDTFTHLSVIALGIDLTARTCELLSSLQKWSVAPNGRYNGSQRHIKYFVENPFDTVALFLMAWHGNLSSNVRTICERFIAFAETQELTKRLAIIRGTEILLDHRAFYMRDWCQASMSQNVNLLQEIDTLENTLEGVERILQEAGLLCQSAIYREYMEKLSQSKGDKAGEMWKGYWELQVDEAIAKKEGRIWTLLETLGYPAKAFADDNVKAIGKHLWSRLSQPIHHPNLQAVENDLNTPLDYWREEEREVLLAIKEMVHEQVPIEIPEWKKKPNWRPL